MAMRKYSERLGSLSDEQLQAALHRFDLGIFLQAEAIPFGSFGQNVFITSSKGRFVLRGDPHFPWQFPTEQYYVQQLHEHTQVPVPWPYLIDYQHDIFGWSYVIMPRMDGLSLEDPQVQSLLSKEDLYALAHVLGENLAQMQELAWPFPGRYNTAASTIQPFDLRTELTWPFPVASDTQDTPLSSTSTFSEFILTPLRHRLASTCTKNTITKADLNWAEKLIADAQEALLIDFQPCFVTGDYKTGNLVVSRESGNWRVSGVFDLMAAHFGDGEADLSRAAAVYIDEDPQLAYTFIQAYVNKKPPRPGFARRFQIYMLLERHIIWSFCHEHGLVSWCKQWTFREWVSRYISFQLPPLDEAR